MAKDIAIYADGEIHIGVTNLPCMDTLYDFPDIQHFERTSPYTFKCEHDGITYTINGRETAPDKFKIDSCERTCIDGQDEIGGNVGIEFTYDEKGDLYSTRIIDFDSLLGSEITEYDADGNVMGDGWDDREATWDKYEPDDFLDKKEPDDFFDKNEPNDTWGTDGQDGGGYDP